MSKQFHGWTALSFCLGAWALATSVLAADPPARRPNVVLIITDDQGWGHFGFHGNPQLKTPHLDALAGQSTELTRFYVSPVCSPTRSSLLTGRYNYRTGVVDTYQGRSTMAADEVTLAEMLSGAGYETGIFGKWHLGDHYPSRSIDQGFGTSLVHRGGGIGQPSDPPGGSHYFDPLLFRNGRDEQTHGYCSDIFTNAAIEFISEHRRQPTFVYLAFNCPHEPLEVPPEYHARYQDLSLDDETARTYGMIANIDDNIGRLLASLERLNLDRDTIVVFLTDNGSVRGYNGVWRGRKGSLYEGGIHTACLLRWPGRFAAGVRQDQLSAHIDLTPTLLEACGVAPPAAVAFDGVSLLPWLLGQPAEALERTLFFQWHRGDAPEKSRACAAVTAGYKLVQPNGREEQQPFESAWALYDLAADPGEQHDLIADQPEIADRLKAAYAAWFADVSATRGFPPPRIVVGSEHENPVILTRQDWRGVERGVGQWTIEVATPGSYDIAVRQPDAAEPRTVTLRLADRELSVPLPAGQDHALFKGVPLEPGSIALAPRIEGPGGTSGAHYVEVLKAD